MRNLEYERAAFEMEILIRQSAKVTTAELKEALDNLSLKFNKLNDEQRARVNRFSTPEKFLQRIEEVISKPKGGEMR